jgi:cyclophilin family peptidyl-prolyl cis-trans isomerase
MDQLKRAVSNSTGSGTKKTEKKEKVAKPSTPVAATPSKPTGEAVVFTIKFNDVSETIAIQLRPDLAPQTVAAFKRSIESGFYQGLAVHRAVRGYLIQAGDPTTRDDGAKSTWGTTDNGNPLTTEPKGTHKRGAVAMARRPDQKESSGSQFYILVKDAPALNGQYTVFGEVIAGLDTVTRIAGTSVDENDVPLRRVDIADAKMARAEDVAVAAAKPSKGGLKSTKSEAEKGFMDKLMERIW